MASEHAGQTGATPPLHREDVEQLLGQSESSSALHLRARNLQDCDLSYMDLQGADLQDANLRGANLRGTNLSRADLQGTDLSDADLDGADLSQAWLGKAGGVCARLTRARLSYALLRELDLHNFDLAELNLYHADLSGSDLRGATLRGADLRGADLSTALLHGPELQGAILYRGAFLRDRGQQTGWEETNRLRAAVQPAQTPARATPGQAHPAWVPEAAEGVGVAQPHHAPVSANLDQAHPAWGPEPVEPSIRQPLADREAYLFGAHILLQGVDSAQIRQLFPQGFSFAHCRQFFDKWLFQAGAEYNEREVQALWIGFAQSICERYFEGESNM